MSIFDRIFKEKTDNVKREVDQAEETLLKAEEKIKVLKSICKVSLLREELGKLIENQCGNFFEKGKVSSFSVLGYEEINNKIRIKAREINECVDELLNSKRCSRNCS